MPSVRQGTASRRGSKRARGSAIRLPASSPSPVSRNGGTCASDAPGVASEAHRPMAARAYRLAAVREEVVMAGYVGRGWNAISAMPARLTATPARSHAVGRTPSTPHSHASATAM